MEEKETERKYSRKNTLDKYNNMKVGAMEFVYSMDAHEYFLKFAPLLPPEKQIGNRKFDWENAITAKMSEKEITKICCMANEAYALSRENKPFVFIHKPQMFGYKQRISEHVDTTVIEVRTNDRRSFESDGTVGVAIHFYAERQGRKTKGVIYLDHFDLELFKYKFIGTQVRRSNLSDEYREAFTNKWASDKYQRKNTPPAPQAERAQPQEMNANNVMRVLGGLCNFNFNKPSN